MTTATQGTSVLIPTLVTERLILDAPLQGDFEGYASIVTSERGRFVGGPYDPNAAWLDFSQMVAGWVLRGFGALTVRSKDGAQYLGTVLVHHEMGDPEPELGWLLTQAAEGKGYGLEAGTAMRDWAFENTELNTLVSYVDALNQRAIALAERLGGRPEQGPPGLVTYRYGHRSFAQ